MDPAPQTFTTGVSSTVLTAGRRLLAAAGDHAAIRMDLLAIELAEECARMIGTLAAAARVVDGTRTEKTFGPGREDGAV